MKQIKLGTDASDIEEQARTLARELKAKMPPNIGFTLFLFDMSTTSGRVTYISTAQREDMISVIAQWMKQVAP